MVPPTIAGAAAACKPGLGQPPADQMVCMWQSRPRLRSSSCGTAAPGCDPPKADVAIQDQKTFDLRSNTAEGGCATINTPAFGAGVIRSGCWTVARLVSDKQFL